MDNTTNNPNPPTHNDQQPVKSFSQRTLILILALGAITLFFLFLALRPQFKNKNVTQAPVSPTPTPTPYAQSVLSLVAVQPTGTPIPNTLTYDVNINSNINTVNAVQLELAFDPKILSNLVIKPGPFFKAPVELIKNINYQTGRVSYALGIQPTDYGVKGIGTVAVISFQYTSIGAPSSTTITFLPKTLVASEGVTQSTLKDAQPVVIPLSSPQGTKNP